MSGTAQVLDEQRSGLTNITNNALAGQPCNGDAAGATVEFMLR